MSMYLSCPMGGLPRWTWVKPAGQINNVPWTALILLFWYKNSVSPPSLIVLRYAEQQIS